MKTQLAITFAIATLLTTALMSTAVHAETVGAPTTVEAVTPAQNNTVEQRTIRNEIPMSDRDSRGSLSRHT